MELLPAPPHRTEAIHGHRPYLRPLIEIADEGAAMGVVAVSGEQARMWEWELGELSELGDWTLTPTGDWRERKAQRPSDPARFRGAGASGREQHDQRLEAHRERFLKRIAGSAASEAGERGWRDLLVFGEVEHVRQFVEELGSRESRHVYKKNVVWEPTTEIARRVDELVPPPQPRARDGACRDRQGVRVLGQGARLTGTTGDDRGAQPGPRRAPAVRRRA